jgi:hypothetical protein
MIHPMDPFSPDNRLELTALLAKYMNVHGLACALQEGAFPRNDASVGNL